MAGLLIQPYILERYREEIARISADTGTPIDPIEVPPDGERLDDDVLARIDIALSTISGAQPGGAERRFFGAATRAPGLEWLHVSHAGIDDPVFGTLLDRGVRLSNSSGASAEPIAQTAIAGLLSLARGLPAFAVAQREHDCGDPTRAGSPTSASKRSWWWGSARSAATSHAWGRRSGCTSSACGAALEATTTRSTRW